MPVLTVKAPAKINLILEIQGQRPDGYHALRTVMHTLELSDTLRICANAPGLKITCDHSAVPVDERNLVYQAAELLAKQCGIEPRVHIHIYKRIPIAAGMGGGSSDAAATLLGLMQFWNLNVRYTTQLVQIAKRLGSDVPFFLYGGCALGTGRGERIYPWPAFPGMRIALINPGFPVSTAHVYKKFSLRLTRKKACINMMRRAIKKKNVVKIGENLFNDLESVTEGLYPLVRKIKQDLLDCGASAALMTGSGPTVFGLLPSAKIAEQIKKDLGSHYQIVLVTRTSNNGLRGITYPRRDKFK